MNAIISLCHFCELHGPSVLFCTQAFHSKEPQQDILASFEESGSYFSRDMQLKSPTCGYSNTDSTMSPPQTPTTPGAGGKVSDLCEACRSLMPGQPGYISNDEEAKVRYVSSQHPKHPQVFSIVRQACVRSLSCEVCPGREGPIFFGDDPRGHVFSHTFFIQDSQARGLRRWYSIVVVMMDKIYLLNSWPFLVTHIKTTVIEDLQAKADKVYEAEQAKCPQRVHRLTMSINPTNFLQNKGANRPARSVIELTNDKQVFKKLHKQFTWILKAGSNRLSERLLEGPPTEDSIIDFEQQEETEEGFVKLFSKKDVVEEHVEEGEGEAVEQDPNTPTFRNLRHLMKVLGTEKFHQLAHHVIVGNQAIIRGKQKALVKSFIDCLKELVPRGCCRVIYYSDKYEDSWRCYFLGLPPGTAIPPHADLYVIVDITEPPSPPFTVTSDEVLTPPPLPYDEFKDYEFVVDSKIELPIKSPAVLNKMELALQNEQLSDSVVEQCLVCLKEEWMNKVKVRFKFTKAGGNRSEEDGKKLLQVVGAQEEDKAVLKFWMTGLSVQYRNHMLSSAIHQSASS